MLGDFVQAPPIGKLDLLDSIGGRALGTSRPRHRRMRLRRLNRAKALTVIGEVRVTRREFDTTALEALRPAQAPLKAIHPQRRWWRIGKAQRTPTFGRGKRRTCARDMEAGQKLATVPGLSGTHAGGTPTATQAVLEGLLCARIALGSLALWLGRLPGGNRVVQGSPLP